MRLFVGLPVSDAVRAMAARVAADLKRRLETTIDARWVPLENLHLTVRFIGYVSDDRAPSLIDAISQPLEREPFDIDLGGCGRFPPRGAPRVIWAGVTRGLPPLTALHDEFNRRLAPLAFAPENRPYSAHLTLARIKDARVASARQLDAACEHIHTGSVSQRVDALTVFESRLSSQGPTYAEVRRIPLIA
jgi:2'-5' RNA ligase